MIQPGADAQRDGRLGAPLRVAEPRPGRLRSQLLAGFVAFHILAVVVLALPADGRLADRAVWQSPENQRQFAQWAALASRLGFAQQGPELEQRLWQLSQSYLSARSSFITPFLLYARYAGVGQGWRMFSNPQSHPAYVHVDLGRAGAFEPIYMSRSSAFTWRREQFDHHRLRKLFGRVARSTEPELWEEFGVWAARQAASDFPDATELRIWQERRATPEPGSSAEESPPLPEQARVYQLAGFR